MNTCNELLPNNNEKEDIIFEKGCSTLAVCVCRYQEPIQDLIKTVESIDLIYWPGNKLQLYIMDDGWYTKSKELQSSQLSHLNKLLKRLDEEATCGVKGLPKFETTEIRRSNCASECKYLNLR